MKLRTSSLRRLAGYTLGLAATLALVLAGPARAQDAPRRPADQVSGRNADLKAAFAAVARTASQHVARVTRDGKAVGYAALLDGGWALTSDEVVADAGAYRLEGPAGAFAVAVHARRPADGFALLRVEGGPAKGLPLGRAADLEVGRFVVVVGTEATPIAVGVVSAKERRVEPSEHEKNVLMGLFSDGNEGHPRALSRVLQHDGPTEPAHFGAPVVDGSGALVGLSVACPWRGSSHAVDVDLIAGQLAALTKAPAEASAPAAPAPREGAAARPWLGVSCVDATPEQRGDAAFGLVVREVTGPAAAAGLEAGDVIVAVDGAPVTSMNAFAATVGGKKVGDVVRLGVRRDGQRTEVAATLGARPPR